MILIVVGALGNILKDSVRGREELKIRGRAETIQTTALVKLVKILKKRPRDLRGLGVTQTPMKAHQLTLV